MQSLYSLENLELPMKRSGGRKFDTMHLKLSMSTYTRIHDVCHTRLIRLRL